MSLVGSALPICWVCYCALGEAEGVRGLWLMACQRFDVLVKRPVGSPTSRMPRSAAKIHPFKGGCYAARGMERVKNSFEARHKEKPTSMLERLDR